MEKGFICLDRESYDKINELHRKKKSIPDEFYFEREDAKNYTQLIKAIKKYIVINSKEKCQELLWDFIKELERKCERAKKTEANISHIRFFYQLLSNFGVYTKEQCQRDILTESQIKENISYLEDLNWIVSIKTKRLHGSKTVFMVNLNKIKEE